MKMQTKNKEIKELKKAKKKLETELKQGKIAKNVSAEGIKKVKENIEDLEKQIQNLEKKGN